LTRKPTSFYAEVLALKEAEALERARILEGADDVLAVTQLALREALYQIPRNLSLVFKGAGAASRLLNTRQKLAGGDTTEALIESLERARATFDACPEEARRDPNKSPPA
jgi:hypothetical protein